MGGEITNGLRNRTGRVEVAAGGETLTLWYSIVREPWEFETARIENSQHIPMNDIPARFNEELDPEETYCRGLPSRRALDERYRMVAAAGV